MSDKHYQDANEFHNQSIKMFVINSLVGHTYTFGEKNNEIKCTKLICNIQSWDLKFTWNQ